MFSSCTYLKKINFGKLNFSLSKSFQEMFFDCKNLIELESSNFNTKNSLSFESMFNGYIQLKKLDVIHQIVKICFVCLRIVKI